jgi:hypothetical protein
MATEKTKSKTSAFPHFQSAPGFQRFNSPQRFQSVPHVPQPSSFQPTQTQSLQSQITQSHPTQQIVTSALSPVLTSSFPEPLPNQHLPYPAQLPPFDQQQFSSQPIPFSSQQPAYSAQQPAYSTQQPAYSSQQTQPPAAQPQNNPVSIFGGSHTKLPYLEIKKISGSVEEWAEWWPMLFSQIHTQTNLRDMDKFAYLKSFLTGEAALLVQSAGTSYDCYNAALNKLSGQYARQELVRSMFIKRRMNLPSPAPNTKSQR